MFVFFGGLVVLALTAALVAPYFIDWNHYRSAFEREAERVLGREVSVEGTARARLLPFPSLTFTDVVVAGETPEAPGMTVEEFSMDAELAPFLRGEVLIFDMRLVRPFARLSVAEDGGIDWAVRPSGPFDPRQVTLEKVNIVDGSVALHHAASGRAHRLTGINANLSARTLAGPWRIDGTLAVDDIPMALSVSTGGADADGTMRVRLEALPDELPVRISTDGQARLEDGVAHYSGGFLFDTFGEAEIARLRGDQGATFALRDTVATNRLSGRFDLRHDRLSIEEFRFETGPADAPYHAEGQASVELGGTPRFSITADGAQLRFDPEEGAQGAIAGIDLQKRFDAFAKAVAALPAPTIPGRVSINLPAIVAGDTTIRNIQLRAEPADGGWQVGSVAATLPGRTRFEASGLLTTRGKLAFDGSVLLAIAQPSGFAAWIARDVDDAIRRLPAAGFSADVALSDTAQRFDALELILGDARFNGSLERRQPENARPSLALTLDGDALDLDGIRAFISLFVSDAGTNRLAGHDVDLNVKAGPVTAAGLAAQTLDSALRLRDGVLEIDRLTLGGLAGAQISATGQVRDFAGGPTGKIDATILSPDLSGLAGVMAERFPENPILAGLARRTAAFPGLLADAEINLVASAADNGDDTVGLAISAEGAAGGTDLSFSLSDRSPRADPFAGDFKMSVTARNDDAAALYGLAGLPALPLGLAGEARLELSAAGSLAGSVATQANVTGDGLQAGFEGTMRLAEGEPSLTGRTSLKSDDLEPWLAVAGVVLPGFGLGMPVDLSTELEWSEALAVLSGLTGMVSGSDVSGDLTVSLDGEKPRFEGALELSRLDLAPFAELVLGSGVFSGEDGAVWPEVPFSQDVQIPFSANLDLRAETLWAGFWAGAEKGAMKLRLDAEGLALSDLRAEIYGGTVDGFATLRNNEGTGLLSAQLGLDGAALDALLPQAGLSGRITSRASVSASGKTVNGMAAALSGSGSAGLNGLVIDGLDPGALAAILQRADEAGNAIDAERTAAFAPSLVRDGAFAVGDTEVAYTIAGGVARTPPVRLTGDGATLTAEASADLRMMGFEASGTLAFDPGTEAVIGSEPAVGFETSGGFDAPRTQIVTAPLAQFLTQRALEREQARVERMQSVLLEQQRLRREARYFVALADAREAAEAERLRLEREMELQREREQRARAEEEEAQRRAAEQERAERQRAEGTREAVERAPLSAPNTAGQPKEAPSDGANSRDAVSEFFRAKNLSSDRLLELLGQGE
nr:AsmA family protein [Nitratireductor pacificus]